MLASSCIQLLLKFRYHEASVPKLLRKFIALEHALQNSSNMGMYFILYLEVSLNKKRLLKSEIAVQFGMQTARKSSSLRTIFCSIPAPTSRHHAAKQQKQAPLSFLTCIRCQLLSGIMCPTDAFQGHPAESTHM